MTTNDDNSSVPFTLTAAGHQGMTTDASGSLLIKPCTQAEIDFYESAKLHPAFQAHMPVYMGSLTLNTNPAVIAAATGTQIVPATDATNTSHTPVSLPNDALEEVNATIVQSKPDTAWKPSGGAKLTSNLAVVLGNVTSSFTHPNILDLKLGARLWDEDAPQAKRARLDEVSQTTTSCSLGFRVAGMKVYVGHHNHDLPHHNTNTSREVNTTIENDYKTYEKAYGRSNITRDNVKSAFEAFLSSVDLPKIPSIASTSSHTRRMMVLERLHQEVSSIEFVLEKEESRMYSASILMVYEGDSKALDEAIMWHEGDERKVKLEQTRIGMAGSTDDHEPTEENDEENGSEDVEEDEDEDEDDKEMHKIHEVVMIDFAHAHWTPGQGPDENVLRGVRSIKRILKEMLDDVS